MPLRTWNSTCQAAGAEEPRQLRAWSPCASPSSASTPRRQPCQRFNQILNMVSKLNLASYLKRQVHPQEQPSAGDISNSALSGCWCRGFLVHAPVWVGKGEANGDHGRERDSWFSSSFLLFISSDFYLISLDCSGET